jgi:GAF domain-containing protein
VTHARRVFGVETAMVTLIDHDSLVTLAHVGRTVEHVARKDSICDATIGSPEATIVWDAHRDARLHGRTLGPESAAADFYAGFPVESPTGERLGVLCLFDSHSREREDGIDVELLRELAFMVQSELRHGFGGSPAREVAPI